MGFCLLDKMKTLTRCLFSFRQNQIFLWPQPLRQSQITLLARNNIRKSPSEDQRNDSSNLNSIVFSLFVLLGGDILEAIAVMLHVFVQPQKSRIPSNTPFFMKAATSDCKSALHIIQIDSKKRLLFPYSQLFDRQFTLSLLHRWGYQVAFADGIERMAAKSVVKHIPVALIPVKNTLIPILSNLSLIFHL